MGQLQERRVLCKSCWAGGQLSKVFVQFYQAPLGEGTCYYDEDGRYHVHDGKEHKTQYKCTRGHEWTDTESTACWCGWKEDPKAS